MIAAVSRVIIATAVLAAIATAQSPYLILPGGARFFPIGLYGFPQNRGDDEIYREARGAGFNFLVGREARFGFLRSFDLPEGPPDPDAASRRGSLLDLTYNAARKRELLADIVAANETAPGVTLWQGPDEPNYFPFGTRAGPSSAGLREGAAFLRSRSGHPLWINFSPTGDHQRPADLSSLAPYLAVPDVVSIDIYPVGGGADLQESPFADRGMSSVGAFARNLVEMVSVNGIQQKPVWMVLQAFGWQALGAASNPPEKWNGRPPSFDEIRFMSFDAVINGATGIVYWGAPYLAKGDATWDSLKKVAAELQALNDALTGDILPADHFVHVANRNVETAVRRAGDQIYLLMANASPLAVENAPVEIRRPRRQTLRVSLAPYGVRVEKFADAP